VLLILCGHFCFILGEVLGEGTGDIWLLLYSLQTANNNLTSQFRLSVIPNVAFICANSKEQQPNIPSYFSPNKTEQVATQNQKLNE
jgi:hypothetical protein